MKSKLIQNLLALSLVLLSTASIQAQEEKLGDKERIDSIDLKSSQQVEEPILRDTMPYDVVATPAIYPGGYQGLIADLAENFEYPKEARENKVEGQLEVSFVIAKDGSIDSIEVTQKLGFGLDEAAIAAVKKLKTFIPAKMDNTPVSSHVSLPVECKLD